MGLKFRKYSSNYYTWSIVCKVLNLGTSESRSEITGKLPDVVLEKNGKDNLDGPCEK